MKNSQLKNNDEFVAIFIFLFYISLAIAAGMFLFDIFGLLGFGKALLNVVGCYFSVRILYNFFKDFVALIKMYIVNKIKDKVE